MVIASRLSTLAGLRGNHAVEFLRPFPGELGFHLEHVGKLGDRAELAAATACHATPPAARRAISVRIRLS